MVSAICWNHLIDANDLIDDCKPVDTTQIAQASSNLAEYIFLNFVIIMIATVIRGYRVAVEFKRNDESAGIVLNYLWTLMPDIVLFMIGFDLSLLATNDTIRNYVGNHPQAFVLYLTVILAFWLTMITCCDRMVRIGYKRKSVLVLGWRRRISKNQKFATTELIAKRLGPSFTVVFIIVSLLVG